MNEIPHHAGLCILGRETAGQPQENLSSFLCATKEHSQGLGWGPNLGGLTASSSWTVNQCFSCVSFLEKMTLRVLKPVVLCGGS